MVRYCCLIKHPRIQRPETTLICDHSCSGRAAGAAGPGAFIPGGQLGRPGPETRRAHSFHSRGGITKGQAEMRPLPPGLGRQQKLILLPTCRKRTKAFFSISCPSLRHAKRESSLHFSRAPLCNGSHHFALYGNAQAHLRHSPIAQPG